MTTETERPPPTRVLRSGGAESRPLPRARGLRRARRAAALLRGLRRGRGDHLPDPDLVAGPLPPLEDADPLLRPPLPRAGDGRPRQRPLGSLPRPAALRAARVRPRLPGRDGRDRHRAGGDGRASRGRPVPARAGAARPRAGGRRRLHRPDVPLHPVAVVGAAATRGSPRAFARPRRSTAGGAA